MNGKHACRKALYAKRLVELARYTLDFKQNRIAAYSKLSDAEKLEMFGSTIVPIHVPLARGESMRQYEERFVEWLESTQGFTLRELENHDDEALERFYRIKFANLNATGEVGFYLKPHNSKRGRPGDDKSPRPAKKPAFGDDKPSSNAAEDSAEETFGERDSTHVASSASRECSLIMPPDSSLTSAVAIAYIACGCRLCLVKGLRLLTAKVAELSESACKTCQRPPSEAKPNGDVVDLTQDDDLHSPKNKSKDAPRFAVAVATLVTSETILDELLQQLTTESGGIGDNAALPNDPVEEQLMAEYEKLNQTVLKRERALGDVMARLTRTPVTDTTETTRLQDEIQRQREEIEQEAKTRNATLAMVIAHVWRHKRDDLERRLANPQNQNVLHIERMSHEKVSDLTAAICSTQQKMATIQEQVDAALAATPTKEECDRHLALVTRLGNALTEAKRELRSLLSQRRQEFARLIEFDEHLRARLGRSAKA